MVHAFIAAGLLIQQYLSLCYLARLGVVGKRYIYQGKRSVHIDDLDTIYYNVHFVLCGLVYQDLHYMEAVGVEAEHSMITSVTEVKELPHYEGDGEVRMIHCQCGMYVQLYFYSLCVVGYH